MANTPDMAPTAARKGNGGKDRPATLEDSLPLDEQIARLREDLKSITLSLTRLTGDKVSEARGVARHEYKSLVRQGQHAIEEATDELGAAQRQIKDSIRERPLTAVATAVGVGFLIALLTRRP